MRSSPTWPSILKKSPNCAFRYFRPTTGVSTSSLACAAYETSTQHAVSIGRNSCRPARPAVRFGALPGTGLWMGAATLSRPAPGDSSARPLRISVRGALGCGVRL